MQKIFTISIKDIMDSIYFLLFLKKQQNNLEKGKYDHSWRALTPSHSPRFPPIVDTRVKGLRLFFSLLVILMLNIFRNVRIYYTGCP